VSARRIKLTRASEVTPEPTAFLWAPYIPSGEVSLLAGQPGVGKSTFCAWLAAQVTRGRTEGTSTGSAGR